MNFVRLSTNLIDVIDEVLKNQELVNLIGSNGNFPVATPVVSKDIAPYGKNQRLYPYPFDVNYTGEVKTQMHIYYPNFSFENNGHTSEVMLIFDIVVHKDIWLMLDNNKKVVRPYQIVNKLLEIFKNKRIGNLGKIHFLDGSHTIVNSEFEGIRLVAKFTEF